MGIQFSGCGPKQKVESYQGPNYRDIIPFEFVETVLTQAELGCGKDGCEPTVGYFVAVETSSLLVSAVRLSGSVKK